MEKMSNKIFEEIKESLQDAIEIEKSNNTSPINEKLPHTYVMSDIHGDMGQFQDIMQQINFKRKDTLYILGDIIDRGSDGIAILKMIMRKSNIKMILGNHEFMMLEAMRNRRENNNWNATSLWHYNGGEVTHQAFKRLHTDTKCEMLLYLAELPLSREIKVNGEKFLLIHGLPENKNIDDFHKRAEICLWERLEIGDEIDYDGTVIFGHTPTFYYQRVRPLKIYRQGNQIGIDCGAYFKADGGRLCCLRLDDMKEYYAKGGSNGIYNG